MELHEVRIARTRGTPQRGVIIPSLSNLFMHYTFDLWPKRTHPDLPWCRYADDGLLHCRTEQEAEALKAELQARLAECHLELHPTKTRIVYCKDDKRKGAYPNVKFDFLGYQFRPRAAWDTQSGGVFCGFTPAISPSALKTMRATIRELDFPRHTQVPLAGIAQRINPLLRGWMDFSLGLAHSQLSVQPPWRSLISSHDAGTAGRLYTGPLNGPRKRARIGGCPLSRVSSR